MRKITVLPTVVPPAAEVPNDGTAVMGPAPKGRPSMEAPRITCSRCAARGCQKHRDVQFLPERPDRRPPGPPPKVGAGADVRKAPPSTGGLQDLPPNVKPPPPPPKKAAGGEAATRFMPTTLRTKKPSQVAGGVLQASSASLSQENRKKVLLREAPKVAEKLDIEDAFQ
ncbi:Copia protein, partial [Durusdinium trenchii]